MDFKSSIKIAAEELAETNKKLKTTTDLVERTRLESRRDQLASKIKSSVSSYKSTIESANTEISKHSLKGLADELAETTKKLKSTTDSVERKKLESKRDELASKLKSNVSSVKSQKESHSSWKMNELGIKVEDHYGPKQDSTKDKSQPSISTSSKKDEEAKVNDSFQQLLQSMKQNGSKKQSSIDSKMVNLSFMIDGTGSMAPWIEQTQTRVLKII